MIVETPGVLAPEAIIRKGVTGRDSLHSPLEPQVCRIDVALAGEALDRHSRHSAELPTLFELSSVFFSEEGWHHQHPETSRHPRGETVPPTRIAGMLLVEGGDTCVEHGLSVHKLLAGKGVVQNVGVQSAGR